MPGHGDGGLCEGGQTPTIPAPPLAELTDTLPDAGSRFPASSAQPLLASGTLIANQFRIDRLLGAGATGQVFLARDETLDRDVAVKVISGTGCNSELWRAQVLNEARTMARVRHENVVALHAVGEFREWLYLVMDYVKGVDLHAWMQDRGPVSIREAHTVISQLSRGLQAIHDGGAVHRDVKPGNVLVGAGLHVELADFGLARCIDSSHVSGEHGVVGTPAYVAPEMILCQNPSPALLNRIDIYSLGVVSFELVTGRLPFDASTPARIILDHVATPAPPITSYRRDVPPSVSEAISAAMAKAPEARPPSAMAFLAWFERDLDVSPSAP